MYILECVNKHYTIIIIFLVIFSIYIIYLYIELYCKFNVLTSKVNKAVTSNSISELSNYINLLQKQIDLKTELKESEIIV